MKLEKVKGKFYFTYDAALQSIIIDSFKIKKIYNYDYGGKLSCRKGIIFDMWFLGWSLNSSGSNIQYVGYKGYAL